MDAKGKALWLASSQVALGMKVIHDLIPSFNILYNAPFFLTIDTNTFLILNVSDH